MNLDTLTAWCGATPPRRRLFIIGGYLVLALTVTLLYVAIIYGGR